MIVFTGEEGKVKKFLNHGAEAAPSREATPPRDAGFRGQPGRGGLVADRRAARAGRLGCGLRGSRRWGLPLGHFCTYSH